MIKIVCFFLFFIMMPRVYGQECKVYGISDSPQKLDCSFGPQAVRLHCQKGEYFVGETPVESAFHMEVETGPVPLVFKTQDGRLTVLIESENKISAEWERAHELQTGTCHF